MFTLKVEESKQVHVFCVESLQDPDYRDWVVASTPMEALRLLEDTTDIEQEFKIRIVKERELKELTYYDNLDDLENSKSRTFLKELKRKLKKEKAAFFLAKSCF